jgi:hypothetical protein
VKPRGCLSQTRTSWAATSDVLATRRRNLTVDPLVTTEGLAVLCRASTARGGRTITRARAWTLRALRAVAVAVLVARAGAPGPARTVNTRIFLRPGSSVPTNLHTVRPRTRKPGADATVKPRGSLSQTRTSRAATSDVLATRSRNLTVDPRVTTEGLADLCRAITARSGGGGFRARVGFVTSQSQGPLSDVATFRISVVPDGNGESTRTVNDTVRDSPAGTVTACLQ